MSNDESWRTTAYCDRHGIRRIVSVDQLPTHPREGVHLAGVLVCGCRFSINTSTENARLIRDGISKYRPVIIAED